MEISYTHLLRKSREIIASVSRLSPNSLIGRQGKIKTREDGESQGNNLTGNPSEKIVRGRTLNRVSS